MKNVRCEQKYSAIILPDFGVFFWPVRFVWMMHRMHFPLTRWKIYSKHRTFKSRGGIHGMSLLYWACECYESPSRSCFADFIALESSEVVNGKNEMRLFVSILYNGAHAVGGKIRRCRGHNESQ